MDSLYDGKFLIAVKGQAWNAGCEQTEDVPSCQFIDAIIKSNQYKLNLFSGGLAGEHKKTIIVNFENNVITSYSLGYKLVVLRN